MGSRFQPGELVRQKGTGLELTVEGYGKAGLVRCSFRKEIARLTTSYAGADLERIPPPAEGSPGRQPGSGVADVSLEGNSC